MAIAAAHAHFPHVARRLCWQGLLEAFSFRRQRGLLSSLLRARRELERPRPGSGRRAAEQPGRTAPPPGQLSRRDPFGAAGGAFLTLKRQPPPTRRRAAAPVRGATGGRRKGRRPS